MNLLVVGGAGYIGSTVAHQLVADGHRVIILDDFSKGHRETIPEKATLVEGDLGDMELVSQICQQREIEAALHFAAYIEVGESVRDPKRYFENNTVKTKHLLDALLGANVKKFIFSSTAAVYGEPVDIPITEDHPKNPTNPYGWSKLMVEEILESYQQAYDLQSVRLRYFNAAGALEGMGEDHFPESHLIPLVLQVALGQRDNIKVFGSDWDTPDGTCVRDYIHVEDLAKAHSLAVSYLADGNEGTVFNLGNGSGHSVSEVIETARQVTGHPIPVENAPRRPGDPARLVASAEKAKRLLRWAPKHPDLIDIVQSAWNWHQSRPNGYNG